MRRIEEGAKDPNVGKLCYILEGDNRANLGIKLGVGNGDRERFYD